MGICEVLSAPRSPWQRAYIERVIGSFVVHNKMAASDASIWIRCFFGRQQTSKTNCSISGRTLTAIARIPRWKGEHQMRPRHDQSSISARLDGNLTVGTYTRRQWLRDFQKTLDRCDIRSNSARLPRNHSVFLRRQFAAPINSLFTATSCVPEVRSSSLSQSD